MDAAPVFSSLQLTPCPEHSPVPCLIKYRHPSPSKPSFILRNRNIPSTSRTSVVAGDVSAIASDPAQAADVSWQTVVGALAGVTPFVVAGIEFGKRIAAQRNCKTCKGSGLVLRDNEYYFRCPACGGFLPWQSWTRFFTG